MEVNRIYNENCQTGLRKLPDSSIDCCITSPPYYGLRDYGHAEQIGLEETPELYVQKMVEVFSEVKRVLKKEGTLWLNIGDSYCAPRGNTSASPGYENLAGNNGLNYKGNKPTGNLKPKDLIGIPWMLAFALRADGWYLRQDIIWHKPNPMPESVTDRCTKSHEYVFLLSKSAKYYYDAEAIKEESKELSGWARQRNNGLNTWEYNNTQDRIEQTGQKSVSQGFGEIGKANKRSVWTVTTKPYSDAHFATFPEDLVVDMIKAGCPENGIVLDPFMGAGTTALVASKLNRNYIGFELNEQYVSIANKRLHKHLGMFHPSNVPA